MVDARAVSTRGAVERRRAAARKRIVRVVRGIVCASCAAAAVSARAQTPSPLAEWQYSAGVPLDKLFNPQQPAWQIAVGAAGTLQPRYEGSSQYRPMAGPTFDVRYRDLWFASTGEGIGVNVLRGPNWRATISAGYDLGRREADDRGHLTGIGNINPAALIKLSADYVISRDFPLVLRADVRRSIGGANGWVADLAAYMPLPGSSEKFYWFAGPAITFADSRYMNGWFGVNAAQAARSGHPRYEPSAGVKSVGGGVTLVWFVTKHWFVTADGAVDQLVGSAARSPLTQRSTNAVVDVSINYQF